MLSRRLVSTLSSSSIRTNRLCRLSSRRTFASASEVDGNVLTLPSDHEFWKLSTKNNDEKIRDYSYDYSSGRALTEGYFGFPETRLGKPLTYGESESWLSKWIEFGNVPHALSALEKERPRLHNYEILVWGLIGLEGTSEEVTAVLNHAKARVPLTTTFLAQVLEAYVAAKDYEAALALFEDVPKTYNLPVTLELQHKFLGLFQLNPEYADKVAEVQEKFLHELTKGRSKGFGTVNTQELPESDSLAHDPALSVPAEKEQKILRSFLSGVTVSTPFEQGLKEWRKRLDSYTAWHKAQEEASRAYLKKNHSSLLEKYERRNAQITAFLQKRYPNVQ